MLYSFSWNYSNAHFIWFFITGSDMSDMAEERYKSLLIVNESTDAQVTLYLYPTSWYSIFWLFFKPKIIKPNEKYLFRSSMGFKFKLVAIKSEDGRQSKQTLQEPEEWVEDKLLKITESLDIFEGRLEDFPEEKTICLRKAQRDKELKGTNGRQNLYEVLGLDMNQVRKMPKEDQLKAIKKGYQREIKRWHPDKNFGDDKNATEISLAHEILRNKATRARYHNEADYGVSWLSVKRFKAIFCPECATKEQKISYWYRMLMSVLSVVAVIGGIFAPACTAGLAAPVAVALGAVFGGGLLGAGLQSFQHTVSKKSIVAGCDWKQWLIKAGIGFVGAAATGGAAVGITAGIAGIGSAAMESAALTMGQYVGIGAGSGAVGGTAASLAIDAGRKFADGENVTCKQVIDDAVLGAVMGAAAGAAGAAVTKSVVGIEASAATATLEGDIGEHAAIRLIVARRPGKILAPRKSGGKYRYSFSYKPLESQGATLSTVVEEDGVSDQSDDELDDELEDEPDVCRVKYISKGPLSSKMFVSYFLNGERETREVRGSWKSVTIPGNATQLDVKFQVGRLFWGDIKKYDRFNRCWCKPYEPHVFRYNTPPPLRTFTITGTLGWKAVTCVSNEYHDETKDM